MTVEEEHLGMRIQLDDKYWIKTDKENYTLFTIQKGKTEKDVAVGHYGTWKQLMIGYCKRNLKECEATDMQGVLDEINRLRDFINDKFKGSEVLESRM